MPTVTECLRSHALEMAGYFVPCKVPDLDCLQQTEWFPEFERLMRNRLVMGAFRYGLMERKLKQKYDMFGYLQRKVAEYAATGLLPLSERTT
jgi:hypothetical protein